MIRMEPLVRIIVIEDGDPFRTYLNISNMTFAIAENEVCRRTSAVMPRQLHDFGYGSLLQHDALQRIMREPRLPLEIVQSVGKVGDAELIHARISKLSGEGEHQACGAPVA